MLYICRLPNPKQRESGNTGIRRRLLDLTYNFKSSNEHDSQELCSVNRPTSLNENLLCFLTSSNTLCDFIIALIPIPQFSGSHCKKQKFLGHHFQPVLELQPWAVILVIFGKKNKKRKMCQNSLKSKFFFSYWVIIIFVQKSGILDLQPLLQKLPVEFHKYNSL